ncbi:hypothetical protein NDU88_007594 [Pleurodeles waltl]|uniref:Uncharacterized protein n=1 Tax=Pleurodeles waltl TaxID=8319 RepID=A0AAV7U074_PLEWA|nr:hypothetical protein NDU88_007594 [Pleurodeles waltl]
MAERKDIPYCAPPSRPEEATCGQPGEAWRLSPCCTAFPGCPGRGGAGRSRVLPRQWEERDSARRPGRGCSAAWGAA